MKTIISSGDNVPRDRTVQNEEETKWEPKEEGMNGQTVRLESTTFAEVS